MNFALPFRRTALAVAGGGRAGFAGAAAPARRERAPRATGADGVAAFREGTHGVAQPGAAALQETCCCCSPFALAGLALARPQWGSVESAQAWRGRGRGVRAGLFAQHAGHRRFAQPAAAREICHPRFCAARQSHGRVGLVAFAGSAFIQCPLTFDYDAFEETLLSVDEKTIPIPGTDIGRALNEAYRAMDKTSRHKLIVLVTDGEDLEKSGGVTAAKNLATNGVVVFTIGVGTRTGKEIQIVNAAGRRELLRGPDGGLVHSRLDEQTLREIAQATGGDYFRWARSVMA